MNILTKYENSFEDVQFRFISILFALIPILLVSGPFLSDLSLVLIDLFFFNLYSYKKKILFF